ncbi:hypothetical protein GCM10023217_32130 [Gordonia alkaliphila]|uniref:Lipoprotein n=1 Tax=Gordonia alkaliphila TaxID=1053547 RepID=A0ABP8ZIA7_9ACTN
MQTRQPRRGRLLRALISGAVGAAVVAGATACGDYPNNRSGPGTGAKAAQVTVEDFVSSYNEAGLGDAVERTVCTEAQADFAGKQSLDGSPYTAGSMTQTQPASVNGDSGRAAVQVASAQATTQSYEVALERDRSQGWCITGLTAKDTAPGQSSSPAQ